MKLKADGRLEALMRFGTTRRLPKMSRYGCSFRLDRLKPSRCCGSGVIQEVIQSLLETRRYDFDVERAVYLTVLHRLFASGR